MFSPGGIPEIARIDALVWIGYTSQHLSKPQGTSTHTHHVDVCPLSGDGIRAAVSVFQYFILGRTDSGWVRYLQQGTLW